MFKFILKRFCSETELKYLEIIKGGRIDCFATSHSSGTIYRIFVGNIKFLVTNGSTTVFFLDKTGDDDTGLTKSSFAFYILVESLYDDRQVVIERQARIDEKREGLALYNEVVTEMTKYNPKAKSDEY